VESITAIINDDRTKFNTMLVELIQELICAEYNQNKFPFDINKRYYLQVNIRRLITMNPQIEVDINKKEITELLITFFKKYDAELGIIKKWIDADYTKCHDAKIEFDNLITKMAFNDFKKIFNKYMLAVKL